MGRGGVTVWFTGLSGAGKSTVTALVARALRARGLPVEVLDGDVIRKNLSKGLGFSKEDRDTNVRRIGFVAELLVRHGVIVLVAAIAPYRAVREENRQRIGSYVEVWVSTPLEACERRDPKGLYAKVRAGLLSGFTGVDDPYEPPTAPELSLDTQGESPERSAERVLERLRDLGVLSARPSARACS